MIRQKILFSLILVAFVLAGCGTGQIPTQSSATPSPLGVTQVVATAPGEQDEPTPDVRLVPMDTPTPDRDVFYPHLEKPFYFSYDGEVWDVALVNSGPRLIHRKIDNCYINDAVYSERIGPQDELPQRIYLNGRNWSITHQVIYTTGEDDLVQLELGSRAAHKNEQCKQDQEAVLGNLVIEGRVLTPEVALPTFTPLPEYYCPDAPEVRLAVGKEAITVTEVLLRSSPERLSDNVIKKLPAGMLVRIEDGPVCGTFVGGAYAYWKVTVVRTGDEGYLAEGSPSQEFLREYE